MLSESPGLLHDHHRSTTSRCLNVAAARRSGAARFVRIEEVTILKERQVRSRHNRRVRSLYRVIITDSVCVAALICDDIPDEYAGRSSEVGLAFAFTEITIRALCIGAAIGDIHCQKFTALGEFLENNGKVIQI